MKNFAGKIAFITGGASGAGLGQAKLFSKSGMRVAIADMRQDALDNAVGEIIAYSGAKPEDVLALKVDLTNRAEYIAAADKAEEVFGAPPHLLIQTAGVNAFGPAETSTFEDFDWIVGVCFNAVVNGLVIFVPRMVKAYGNKEEFHIAATSSYAAFMGLPGNAPYDSAKAAVLNLHDSYYKALVPYGGGATVLCPQNINSNIFACQLYRPESLAPTGYNTTETTMAFLKNMHSQGMDPVELAGWLKRAIENDQLIVLPYDNAEEMLRGNYERYIKYASPEGMKQIREQDEAERLAAASFADPGVGFGAARAGIDWVHESKKPK
ncbi:MAG: SDR family NAD(P)-dependent oxidoreductase [Oscillospiraceae bacterium]|jgi:NAD(P)-dependent dehydrogenase (short-subunit alcohol dehydrogenase family)|nr:SDR family NAD(P)-dependent oxidoreductase [Oscillospiraceae bacterium]